MQLINKKAAPNRAAIRDRNAKGLYGIFVLLVELKQAVLRGMKDIGTVREHEREKVKTLVMNIGTVGYVASNLAHTSKGAMQLTEMTKRIGRGLDLNFFEIHFWPPIHAAAGTIFTNAAKLT